MYATRNTRFIDTTRTKYQELGAKNQRTLITNWIVRGGQGGGLESEAAIHSEDTTLKSGAIYLTLNELRAHL